MVKSDRTFREIAEIDKARRDLRSAKIIGGILDRSSRVFFHYDCSALRRESRELFSSFLDLLAIGWFWLSCDTKKGFDRS